MSATAPTPADRSIAAKRAAARLECPMLNRSKLVIVTISAIRINDYHK
jgi:hypothetical protein